MTQVVLSALNLGEFPTKLNHTFITLIPKKKPSKVADYHPIILCNVLYKLISKVLTNRLRVIMLEIISESQSAFVHGRQIFDNVLIAYELIHFLRHKKTGKRGYMSINLDMSKA